MYARQLRAHKRTGLVLKIVKVQGNEVYYTEPDFDKDEQFIDHCHWSIIYENYNLT